MIKDRRLTLLDALITHADRTGSIEPYVYRDDMIERLGVCEHVFNIMYKQLGERYCRMVDSFEERVRYTIDINRCLELREQILNENTTVQQQREGVRRTLFATSIGTFLAIFIGCCIF